MEGDIAQNDLNCTSIQISTTSNPLRDLLWRRKHHEPNCRYITARRDSLYKEFPISQLVPLAFHTTSALLENFQDIDAIVQAVSKEYTSDLFSDWQRYCKALNFQQRAVATFGIPILLLPIYTDLSQRVPFFFAAQSIPGSEEREVWSSSCLDHLRLLERLISNNEGDGSGRKRKRGASQDGHDDVVQTTSIETAEAPAAVNLQAEDASNLDSSLSQKLVGLIHNQEGATGKTGPGDSDSSRAPQVQDASQVEANGTNIAIVAQVDKLKTTLGGYLFKGLDTSRIRRREKEARMMKFTDTVHLHLAYREGEDFKLEVWLGSSMGKAISQAKMRSVEDLRGMLGDYLFEAMDASNWRKEEKRKGMSDILELSMYHFRTATMAAIAKWK